MSQSNSPVFFYCPGTAEKPRHDCTVEAVSALVNVLEGPPTTIAFPPSPPAVTTAEEAERRRKASPKTYTLQELRAKVGGKKLRIQVKCRTCATISILTDKLITEAEPVAARVEIDLLLPTPGDEALIKAAEGVSGLEALKASTSNAAFVLGNLALLTSLVTTLGLVKADEIGTTLTERDKGWLLVLAGAFGIASIVLALWAQVVSTRELSTGNLEEVRVFVKEEVETRASKSKISLGFLAAAAVSVAVAFLWTLLDRGSDSKPTGRLAVTVRPATLDAGVETAWSGAKDMRVVLTVRTQSGEPLLTDERDTTGGAAEIKTSFHIPRAHANPVIVTILSRVVKPVPTGIEPVAGASKQQCVEVQPTGAVAAVDCP